MGLGDILVVGVLLVAGLFVLPIVGGGMALQNPKIRQSLEQQGYQLPPPKKASLAITIA